MLGAFLLPQPGSAQTGEPARAASRRLLRRLVYTPVRVLRGTGKLRGSPCSDKCT
ncbi:MAG TPA: hypothetical protein VFI54_11435 [Solirubrobacteraceae bacterium]|nr:hypothetical protein [Solirubrobacteraceae bacterium]